MHGRKSIQIKGVAILNIWLPLSTFCWTAWSKVSLENVCGYTTLEAQRTSFKSNSALKRTISDLKNKQVAPRFCILCEIFFFNHSDKNIMTIHLIQQWLCYCSKFFFLNQRLDNLFVQPVNLITQALHMGILQAMKEIRWMRER